MLTIALDPELTTPLYEQIYLFIRNSIRTKELATGTKLPSSRALAEHLSVSRNTVSMAYDQLLSEGYLESRERSGFYVADVTANAHYDMDGETGYSQGRGLRSSNASISKAGSDPEEHSSLNTKARFKYDFSPFGVDTSLFPYVTWQRLARRVLSENSEDIFLLGDRQGEPAFRLAIRNYLHQVRGLNVSEDNIIVGAGADYLLQLLVQLLGFPEKIAMEDPCYIQAYRIFKGLGCGVEAVPFDGQCLSVASIRSEDAAAVYVTPSHQYPLGLVMSAQRRTALLEWAAYGNRYLIEDDHDSDFRYKGRMIPALKEYDPYDRVIYIGTFSRTVAPAIRAGYMVLPDSLMSEYRQHFAHYASTVSRIDQMVLTSFINEGGYERHLNRCRKLYRSRHDTLLAELKTLPLRTKIYDENGGLHIAVSFPELANEDELIGFAAEKGIKLYGVSNFCIDPVHNEEPTIIFGFAGMSEEEIHAAFEELRNFSRS